MASERLPGAYVRTADPSEHRMVAQVLTRAFARDPAMNWHGRVKRMVPDCNAMDPISVRTMRRLHYFQTTVLKLTYLLGGLISVAVILADAGTKDEGESERIIGVTLWLKPGQTFDFGFKDLKKSGIHKVAYGWGIEGLKRILMEFTSIVERTVEASFKTRGKDRLDSWHLLETAVDPAYEGKGICTLMMQDGFSRTSPKPIHLEATTPRSRDIYASFGFEVDEEHQFGRGKVNANGLKAKGDVATGYLE